jgi:hypothetical protein
MQNNYKQIMKITGDNGPHYFLLPNLLKYLCLNFQPLKGKEKKEYCTYTQREKEKHLFRQNSKQKLVTMS